LRIKFWAGGRGGCGGHLTVSGSIVGRP
jgi:hypothetical protein